MRRAGPFLIAIIGILSLVVDFFPDLKLPAIGDRAGRRPGGVETKLGLDLQGGLRVEYQALPKDGRRPARRLGVIKDIIERRVNATGVSEPVVVVQGNDRVVIELPGVADADSVRRLVGQTGRLDFVPLRRTTGDRRPGSST